MSQRPGLSRLRAESQFWLLAGEMVVGMMTEGRAFSNTKAKRELGWDLRYPSWRQGFKEDLT